MERTALPTAAKLLAFSKILHQRLAPPDALVDRDVIREVARHFRLADAAQLVDEAELPELAQAMDPARFFGTRGGLHGERSRVPKKRSGEAFASQPGSRPRACPGDARLAVVVDDKNALYHHTIDTASHSSIQYSYL